MKLQSLAFNEVKNNRYDIIEIWCKLWSCNITLPSHLLYMLPNTSMIPLGYNVPNVLILKQITVLNTTYIR